MPKTKFQIVFPNFFDQYIKLVDPEMELVDLLAQFKGLYRDQLTILHELGDLIYAPNKWTIKQILQHIIDNERIQSVRLLRLARNEGVPLPGYDENVIANWARVNHRTLESLIDEFELARENTIMLVSHLDEEELSREGTCNNLLLKASDLGFQMVGHQIHHQKVIEDRYFALI